LPVLLVLVEIDLLFESDAVEVGKEFGLRLLRTLLIAKIRNDDAWIDLLLDVDRTRLNL